MNEQTLDPKQSVLFVCTHNSARSQMAEGLLRSSSGDRYEVHSAGTEPGGVNPFAVLAMAELGVDLSSHTSKTVDEFVNGKIDYVVTVCDSAREKCPFIPAAVENIHMSFPDPSATEGDDEAKLNAFRTIRDSISEWLETKFK